MRNSFDEVVEIATPENVSFEFRLAGLGSRFIALAVDMLVQLVVFGVVTLALALVGAGLGALADVVTGGKAGLAEIITSVTISLVIICFFLIQWGYFVWFETRSGGQTPGKRLMHLRVVRDEGQPVRFFDSVIRNVLRIADLLPATYMIGVISILANRQNKRVGDLAAGTIVVRESQTPAPAVSLAPGSGASQDAELVAEYLRRRDSLTPAGRLETAKALANLLDIEADGDEEALAERLKEVVSPS